MVVVKTYVDLAVLHFPMIFSKKEIRNVGLYNIYTE